MLYRKWFTILLTLCMVLSLMPATARAEGAASGIKVRKGETLEELAAGEYAENYGTIVTNNGTVTQNLGIIYSNYGTVSTNQKNGEITDNYETGVIETNGGKVGVNWGIVSNNNGRVELNRKNVKQNLNIIGKNLGTVNANENSATIESNEGTVEKNCGTVAKNTAGGIVFNTEQFKQGAAIKGVVTKNSGEVYNDGGTVSSYTSNGTEYFQVVINNPVDTHTAVSATELKDAYDRQWLGVKGGVAATATITLAPDEGYEINQITGLPSNVTAAKNTDGTWTLTVTGGQATELTVPKATEKKYTVTVNNGTGSGSYYKGQVVPITANNPPEGQRFEEWTGVKGLTFISGNAKTATAFFTMPNHDVTITAMYEPVYTLTVQNGTGSGKYKEGEMVTIKANDPPEEHWFKEWTIAEKLYFVSGNETEPWVIFSMPGHDLVVTATYKKSLNHHDITVDAIADQTYTGSAIMPTVTVKDGETTLTQDRDYAVAYSNNTNTARKTATDAPTVTITGIGSYINTRTETFTIAKRPITITAVEQAVELNGEIATGNDKLSVTGDFASGQSLSSVSIKLAEGIDTSAAGEYDKAIVPSEAVIRNASSENVTANYAITYVSGKLTVAKSKAKVTTAPEAKPELKYTGAEQQLITAGAADTVMEYALGTNASTAPTDGYSTAVPNAKDAKPSYYVWYRAKADANHEASEPAVLTVSIGKVPLTVTAKNHTITYGDTPANDGVEYSGFVNGETESILSGTLTYEYSYAQYGDVGNSYTITPKGLTSDNYEISITAGTLTVNPKPVTITGLSASNKVYDGNATATPTGTASIDGKVGDDDVSVDASAAKAEFADANAGNGKTVTFSGYALSGMASGNYTLSAQPTGVTANITPKSITGAMVTLDKTQLEYNGTEQSVSVTGLMLDGVALTTDDYDVTSGAIGTNVNPYTLIITGKGNYTGTATAAWEITAKPMTVTAPNVTENYDGLPHGISVTISDPSSGTTIRYGNAADACTADDSPTITNVGTLTVYYKVTADNYIDYTGSATISIATKTVSAPTITLSSEEFTYDGQAKTPTVTVRDGDTVIPSSEYEVTYSNNTSAGTATVTITDEDGGNYIINGNKSFTIGKKAITPTIAVTGEYTFNGNEIMPFYTVKDGETQLKETDYSATISDNVNAGQGKITVTEKESGNYTFQQTEQTFTIKKASAQTIADFTQSQIYTIPTVSAAVAGKLPQNAGTLTYTVGTAQSTGGVIISNFAVDATGQVTASISEGIAWDTITLPVVISSTNYQDSTINVVITLTEKENAVVSIEGDASITKTYGDAPFKLTGAVKNPGENGSWIWSSLDSSIAEVSTDGTVTLKSASETPITITATYDSNTTSGTSSVNLTVNAATMEVIATGYTGTYDGDSHGITVRVTNPASGATIKYGTAEGTYNLDACPEIINVTDSKTVYFKVTASNYNEYTGSATVTLSKADQAAPAVPTAASVSVNSITLTAIDNGEYSKDGTTWQESPVFTGLTMNTSYAFYQRLKGDDNHDASPASPAATISTSNHAHEWSYEAQGTVITATCADTDGGHGTPKTATLTINAPALTTYGGSESAEATITGSIDGVENPGIVYKKGSDTLNAAPTDAGTYTASITLGGVTASVEYTIAPKPVTVSGITADDKPYDGTTDATLVTTAANFIGKLDGDNLTITGTGTFDNANVGDSKTVTISNLTLDGTGKDNYVLAAEGQQTNATAAITAKEVGLTWSNTELTYTGEAQKPTATATGLVDGDTCTVTVTGEQTNAGDNYTATAESLSNSNYKLPENKTTVFKIGKADLTLSVSLTGWTHGADANTPNVTGNTGDGAVTYEYKAKDAEDSAYSAAVPTAAGEYKVKATVAETANYNGGTATADFTINKAGISVTVTFKVVNGKWDDDTTADKTVTLSGYEGDTLKLTAADIPAVGNKPNVNYKAGSWDVTPSTETAITADTTYTYTYATYVPSKVTPTVTPPVAKDLTYNGSAQELVTAGSTTGGTLLYALGTEDGKAPATDAYSEKFPTGTDAGDYTVWYKVEGDADTYGVAPKSIPAVTIKKAPAPMILTEDQMPQKRWNLVDIDEDQELVKPPKELPEGYTSVQYSTDGGQTWADAIPTGKSAGDYEVLIRYIGDGNNEDFTIDPIAVPISDDPLREYVKRCYRLILNRQGDEEGIDFWVEELRSQRQYGASIVDEFTKSAEFIARGLSDEEIVDIFYRAMLGREPEREGYDFWLDGLKEGRGIPYLVWGFSISDEFAGICSYYGILRGGFPLPDFDPGNTDPEPDPEPQPQPDPVEEYVRRCYELILNREGEEEGVAYWTNLLKTHAAAGADIVSGFVGSDEFTARNLSNEEIVAIFYRTMLGREPEEGGYGFWLEGLEAGYGTDYLVWGFAGSAEFAGICAEYGITPGDFPMPVLSTEQAATESYEAALEETSAQVEEELPAQSEAESPAPEEAFAEGQQAPEVAEPELLPEEPLEFEPELLMEEELEL